MGAIIQLFWQYLRIRAQEPVFLGMWQLGKRLDAACKFLSNYMCQLSFMVAETGLWIRQLYWFYGECIRNTVLKNQVLTFASWMGANIC